MLRIRKKGQTTMEYIVLIIIVIGALLAMQNYFKRGLQGRWKAAIDDFSDQYDPRVADSSLRYTLVQNTSTSIFAVPVTFTNIQTGITTTTGYWTKRTDDTVSVERKQGNVEVGAY